MPLSLIATGILAPTLFWILYFRYKDRYQPEPVIYIGLAYLMGFIAGLICFKSYDLLPLLGVPNDPSILMEHHRLQFLGYAVGVVGTIEEVMKFLPFLVVIFFFKPFDEIKDGIIYASVIALGFASYENLHYLPYLEGIELYGRAIASPLTQGIFASIWGYAVGKAKLTNGKLLKAVVISLMISALFHGLFDFFTTSPTLRIGSAIVILVIWIWQIRKIEKLDRKTVPKVTKVS